MDLNFRMLEKPVLMKSTWPVDFYKVLIDILDEYLERYPKVNVFGVQTGVIVLNIFLVDYHPFLTLLKHLLCTRQGMVLAEGQCATTESRNILQGNWSLAIFNSEADLKVMNKVLADYPIVGYAVSIT